MYDPERSSTSLQPTVCTFGEPMQARVGPDQGKRHLTAGRGRVVGKPYLKSGYVRVARNTSSEVQRKLWKQLFEHFADRLGRLESCWRKSYGSPKCRLSHHRCGR